MRLITVRVCEPKYGRSRPMRLLNANHHNAEPRKTPSTSAAAALLALLITPTGATPKPANTAANPSRVTGLARVSRNVDTKAACAPGGSRAPVLTRVGRAVAGRM